ncbi:hypothetical protein A2U01_0031501 [Trifolium medium]|uniref:Uncharacterized protein n=1 Tax=Trifolium medium TaxID=97028 RepID=A0A392PE85_9FABA|nr:hypothetical protein [Trifolium medium]
MPASVKVYVAFFLAEARNSRIPVVFCRFLSLEGGTFGFLSLLLAAARNFQMSRRFLSFAASAASKAGFVNF